MSFLECDECGGAVGLFCYCPKRTVKATPVAPMPATPVSDQVGLAIDSMFAAGWRECASWADRADLHADVDSPAYALLKGAAATKSDLVLLIKQIKQQEAALALARDALHNSSNLVFHDLSKKELRGDALAAISTALGSTTP